MTSLDPSAMRAEERRQEIAELLALAYARLVALRKSVELSPPRAPDRAVVDAPEIEWAFGPAPDEEKT